MTITEMEKLAAKGELILEKSNGNTFMRRMTIYKHKFPKSDTEWSDIEGYYDEIKEVKNVPYTKYIYMAKTKNMTNGSFYKITKLDFMKLWRMINT